MKKTQLQRKTPLKSYTPLKAKTSLKARSSLKPGRRRSNKRPEATDRCCICGRPFAHTHEVFYGTANREVSRSAGFQVRLCEEHHQGTSGVHGRDGHALDMELKCEMQAKYEVSHSRQEFISLIGRSYIEA